MLPHSLGWSKIQEQLSSVVQARGLSQDRSQCQLGLQLSEA